MPGMQAQAGDLPVKAPAVAEPVPYWWFHGSVEVGGRFFLNDPQRNGSAYLGQKSLAKFYEYRDLRPGPFGNVWLSTGSSDGLYQIDVGGKNIGYDDQYYYLDASKAGQHYFNFTWDQTPHLYSTSAQTPYLGVGTTNLTLPAGLPSTALVNSSSITNYLNQIDIGIQRDTASAQYRWTPTDSWDIKADYSHLRRTGTQVDGIIGTGSSSGSSGGVNQIPKPVADTTQNYGLNGEYVGTSPWGQKFNLKVAYNGSQYSDDYSSYTVQGLYCNSPWLLATDCKNNNLSPFGRMSLPPSNQANAVSGTLGADLPWNSRYVGTISYTMMRQNDAFIPMSNYPGNTFVLPASSLNGAINTLLSNNVITTKITPELTSKFSYRYYNFQNNTPEILFPTWVSQDQNPATVTEFRISSLSMAYTKQNAGEELTWRPTRQWTFGTAYGYERYDWKRAASDATNENSGKVFADWKPASWATVRSSGYYSNRRYENYSEAQFVWPYQQFTSASWQINPAYRQMMTDNRERWKANVAVDVLLVPGVTITPTFKYQDDHYGINPANQTGLEDSRSWSAGIDIVYVVNPTMSFMVGYMREFYTQLLYGMNGGSGTSPVGGTNSNMTNDRTIVDTFTALARYEAIRDKLDLSLRYTLANGVDNQNLFLGNGSTPSGGQFPNVTTWFQRLDATATYKFDKTQIAQLGATGELKAKLHYAWERNSVSNWSNDPLAPYSPVSAGSANSIWLAYDNPNYNVHLLMASLAYSW